MELDRLIRELSDPSAYPHPADDLRTVQTHISVVFLAGEYVYKIKKPVDFGFIDYSTFEKRALFCLREVEENEALAPGVYLGVETVRRRDDRLYLGGDGEIVEHAVKMRRLPERHLRELLRRGEEITPILDRLADVLARHQNAPRSRPRSASATVDRLRVLVEKNFDGVEDHVGSTISSEVLARLRSLFAERFAQAEPLLRLREAAYARLTHGDLRLDHVYQLDEAADPIVVDCIEFNDALRLTDAALDPAFLAMDLIAEGRRDLAESFLDAYVERTGDRAARRLLPLFIAYRSAVRAKVRGLTALESSVPAESRAECRAKARGHWTLALDQLETPERRPGLVMIGGLPGTGKSTLARPLAESAGFDWIRSDEVRKEIAGVVGIAAADYPEEIYTPEWTERTYAECFRRAEDALFKGRRAVLDATFLRESHRLRAIELARASAVRWAFFVTDLPEEDAIERLRSRRDDVSDADGDVYRSAAANWSPIEPGDRRFTIVDTRTSAVPTVSARLVDLGLL